MAKQHFESTVVRTRSKAYVPVPFAPNDVWGWKVRHYVKGTVLMDRSPKRLPTTSRKR